MLVSEVKEQIGILTNATTRPTLSTEQLDYLFGISRVVDSLGNPPETFSEWESSKLVAVGDLIVPLLRNGNYYSATIAGITGTVEPTWPTATGGTVVDGAVTWVQTGSTVWTPTYNIFYVVSQGWLLKAGNCAHQYDMGSYDQRLQRSQVHKACLEQYQLYKKMAFGGGATIETPSRFKQSDFVPILPLDTRWPEPGASD